jgi:ABC-type transporter Mla subunit MlaD
MGWIASLPDRLESSLRNVLKRANSHEEKYMDAENASVGQLWVAIAQLNQKVDTLEDVVQAQRKALNNLDQDVNVNQHLDEDLEESLRRY